MGRIADKLHKRFAPYKDHTLWWEFQCQGCMMSFRKLACMFGWLPVRGSVVPYSERRERW